MGLALNDLEEEVAKTFKVMFERESTVEVIRRTEHTETGADEHLWRLLIGAGALDVGLASDAGGLLLSSIIAELVGEHLAPVPFTYATCAYRALTNAGAEHADLMAEITTGTKLVTVAAAIERIGTDSHLVPAGTVADAALVRDGDGLWLQARPDSVVRPDTLDAGSSALWPAPSSADKRSIASGPPAETLWNALQTDLRVLAAAELVGMANRAVEIASEYARTRSQFGMLIGSFQGVSHPLADAATAVEGARLLTRKAAWSVDQAEPDRDVVAAMAFVNAWEIAQKAVAHGLRVHGGYGFMTEYDIQLYYRRAKGLPLLIGSRQSELDRLSDLLYGAGH
jgi:alkylation response protein AidB-like acyl-CoA dehydrogenase